MTCIGQIAVGYFPGGAFRQSRRIGSLQRAALPPQSRPGRTVRKERPVAPARLRRHGRAERFDRALRQQARLEARVSEVDRSKREPLRRIKGSV